MKSLQEMIAESDKGFDLFVTEDGVNFENLTTDGFDDDDNMGLRTFISSTDGWTQEQQIHFTDVNYETK